MEKQNRLLVTLLVATALLVGCVNNPTGDVVGDCPQYKCEFKPRAISFELGSIESEGKGIMGSIARIPLTNKADIGAVFQLTIDCKTLNKFETLRSEPMYIKPGDTYTFNIKFDAGFAENWECNNYRVAYEGGDECSLIQI